MHKLIDRVIFLVCIIGVFFTFNLHDVKGSEIQINQDTGYELIIEDEAELFSEGEISQLKEVMYEITEYGNVAVVTTNDNQYYSTEDYIRNYYYQKFGSNSGTVFMIDMDYRNIWIHSNGQIYKTITRSYANTITDNVYKYASDEEYYQCAYKALDQELTLLKGGKIAQPMKYVSNLLLAIILGMFINYVIILISSRSLKPSSREIANNIDMSFCLYNPYAEFVKQTKKYSPQSSGGSGGGGSSGGGGGGGGGHSF